MKLILQISFIASIFSFFSNKIKAQEHQYCQNDAFNQEVHSLLKYNVPVISVDDLYIGYNEYIVLDTREKNEYDVSHIPGAIHIGYSRIDYSLLENIESSKPIVLYCSVGYRSEKIGAKLMKKGFTNVSNLYGSIFEWVNKAYPVVNTDNETVKRVHTYNKKWSKWVDNNMIEKVY